MNLGKPQRRLDVARRPAIDVDALTGDLLDGAVPDDRADHDGAPSEADVPVAERDADGLDRPPRRR